MEAALYVTVWMTLARYMCNKKKIKCSTRNVNKIDIERKENSILGFVAA